MRGSVEGLRSPYPIASLLPVVYQEDPFTVRFTAGLDEVLSVIVTTIDSMHAYVDPDVAPADFLHWLAGWVGLTLDDRWPLHRRRSAVRHAVAFYRMRGTVSGLRMQLEQLFGGTVEIVDNGGVAWSRTPDGPLPGQAAPRLAVRLTTDAELRPGEVDAVVVAAKPAHVIHRVEVMSS